ncbi:GntR family transcriptional regulator [Parafrankia discariae]|uniref:GntR family transcriptional regulator n=1 Tax=Parafrankia discariae TaxID=365528 RepID=UPI000376AE87|nr:winged helix-turn-helix domain-containing protein [Parafrankia discariae]
MPRQPAVAEQLAATLRGQIAAGQPPPGTWLPSLAALAEQHQVAQSTVTRALRLLAVAGLLDLVEGRGARVRGAVDPAGNWDGSAVEVPGLPGEPYTRGDTVALAAGVDLAARLGVAVGTVVPAWQGSRGQLLDVVEEPGELLTIATVPDLAGRVALDGGPRALAAALVAAGLSLRWEDTISGWAPSPEERARLDLDRAPVPPVLVWRRGYDGAGRVVLVVRRLVRTDRVPLVYQYG